MSSSSCIVSVDGSNINTCQPGGGVGGISTSTSLPPLPTIIRHDKEAYFEQRLNLPPLSSPSFDSLLSDGDNDTASDSTSASDDDNKKHSTGTRKLPKKWSTTNQSSSSSPISAPEECRLYMAKSSIPNSGLGIYAGVNIPPNTFVDTDPQIVLPLFDIEDHNAKSSGIETHYDDNIISNYPWNSYSKGAQLEAKLANLLYPNLGMLANSHLGLANTIQDNAKCHRQYSSVVKRSTNPGAGSYSLYSAMSFKTKTDAGIAAGDEVFVDYGAGYFHHREKVWNTFFPTSDDYSTADDIVDEFLDGDIEMEWEDVLALLKRGKYDLKEDEDDEDDDDDDNSNDPVEKKKTQQRIAHALPESTSDLEHVSKIGTAKYSVPNSTLPLNFLKNHGICLDNLRMGKSSIPQGGYGAFAAKNLGAESIIAPAPLVPIKRHVLYMLLDDDDDDNDNDDKSTGGETDEEEVNYKQQLLLNYCFGHPQSSLVFFPYSSSVQYINHDNVNPNAYIRWSDSELSRKEMLEREVDDVYTGMVLEVVALRDIEIGEEITIDYGPDWTNAWFDHVQSWNIDDETMDVNPQSFIDAIMHDESQEKKPKRTMKEQEQNPYPECVRTACYSKENGSGNWTFSSFDSDVIRFCDIIDRSFNKGNYWYTAKLYEAEFDEGDFDPEENEMELIPNQAVFFVPDEYCGKIEISVIITTFAIYISSYFVVLTKIVLFRSIFTLKLPVGDMHLSNAFRHEIGVPEGLYPEIWLDLLDDEGKTLESEKNTIVKENGDNEITTTVKCDTTAGQFSMLFRKSWSPNGYDRVVELFERGFYDNSHFFRVIPGFLTQFGMRLVFFVSIEAFFSFYEEFYCIP